MIPFAEALDRVLGAAVALGEETVDLSDAVGRVLARGVVADRDLPPHDLSAMDGFACRRQDRSAPMAEIGTIPAGTVPDLSVGPGQCARIMTGAIVPQGADTVVMFEDTRLTEEGVVVTRLRDNPNIRRRGEDLHAGDPVLERGTLITPPCIAMLATVGCTSVPVFRTPVVGVIATGDELVEPGRVPESAQIRNSNGPQLLSQIHSAHCRGRYLGIARDTPGAIREKLREALSICEVVLLSGGVSAGDFDHVPGVLSECGVDVWFHSVAVKPGRPTVFGTDGKAFVYGLPGNPVSTFVVFETLVRPFLHRLMGHEYRAVMVRTILESAIVRKKGDRMEFVPVRLTGQGVEPVVYHGSAHMHAYAGADGIVAIAPGITRIEAGAMVEVRLPGV